VLHPFDDGIEQVEPLERTFAAAAVVHARHKKQSAPLIERHFVA
jgi:hypothetical protein